MQNFDDLTVEEKTGIYNKFTLKEKIDFLNSLSDADRKKFLSDIRQQAVKEFWNNERKLIQNGQNTRNWTPEQIEYIMNISEKTGKNYKNAGKAIQINEVGEVIVDKMGNKSYYGHHMIDVSTHPEYAGDWRNIQALNYTEHYEGAHDKHDTKKPTKGYYDVENKKTIEFDVSDENFSFEKVGYPPKTECIFKSDEQILDIYSKYIGDTKLTDGEILALKNIELSMETKGGLVDFNRGLEVASRYNSTNFESKIGIMSDSEISSKYSYWNGMSEGDIETFKAYEYYKYRNVDDACIEKLGVKSDNSLLEKYKFLDKGDESLDMIRAYEFQASKTGSDLSDTKIYFDADGKIIGLSCFDESLSGKAALEVSIKDAGNYLSDTEMSSKYIGYDNYSELDKIKVCQYDYERTQISDMIDNNISSRNDIDLLSMDELKKKYSFINDATDPDIIKELQLAEYRDRKYGTNTADDIKLYFDEDGNMHCISEQGYKSYDMDDIQKSSKFSTSAADYSKFPTDAELSAIYPNYDNLSDLDKLKTRSNIYNYEKYVGDVDITPEMKQTYVDNYNKTVKELSLDVPTKTVDNLNDVDINAIILSSGDESINQKVSDFSNKYESPSFKGGILTFVDVAFTLYEYGTTVKTAVEQFKSGDYEAGTKTVYTAVATESFGFLMSEAFVPAFISVGSVFGPVGMVIGGLIGGFACYTIAGELADAIWSLGECIADLWGDALGAVVRVDPLILDIDGDGFNIQSKKYGANFDLNSDGFAEKINWTSRDAILTLDVNGNGKVDNGREVFGDYHLLADGTRAKNGFEALAQYDKNKDGVIDEKDDIFRKLRLWVDSNCDGVSGAGELKTLKDMGITQIKLDYEAANQTTGTEALIGNVASFVYADKSEGQIGEMWVASDLYDTVETFIVGVSEAVDGLPNVRSYGTVNSLHNAIALDETGYLQELVEQFVAEEDTEKRMKIVEDILWFMCDADSVEAGSRGGNIDARKLKVIESIMGQEFMGVNGSNPNAAAAPILNNAYNTLIEMYCFSMIGSKINHIINYITASKDEEGNITYDTSLFSFALSAGLQVGVFSEREFKDICAYIGYLGSNVQNDFQIFYQTREYFLQYAPNYVSWIDESVYGAINGNEGNNYLYGTTAADVIYGKDGNDGIFGDNSKDFLIGGAGNDTISGGAGDDIIYGDEGNDILDGDAGDDILKDSAGDDTFVFSKGYGNDIIFDGGGHNTLNFGSLNPEDILVNGTGEYDATVTVKSTGETLVIKDFRKGPEFMDYDLLFKDKKMHVTDANSPFRHIYGGEGDDVLQAVIDGSFIHAFAGDDTVIGSKGDDMVYGNEGDDRLTLGAGNDNAFGGAGNDCIYGEAGSDNLFGGEGDDTLSGGEGDDFLYGGDGNDTYLFGKGYGDDIVDDNSGETTIMLADGLSLEDITATVLGDELIIRIDETGEKLMIENYRGNESGIYIQAGEETLMLSEFVSDAPWNPELENDEFTYVEGTDNSDAIFSGDVSNIIATGGQYDYILGGEKDDYIYGDMDIDRILAGLGDDTIFGGAGDDQLFGEAGNDFISGDSGNDYINGDVGNDTILGGAGNDFMDGGSGDDTYYYNAGDGQDSIKDGDGINTIIFGDGITADGIKAYRSNWNDLILTFDGLDDTLIIKNYCIDENARSFKLIFADGTVVNATDNDSPLKTIYSTDASEYVPSIYEDGVTIIGQNGDDQLIGSINDDLLSGEAGNDRIIGNEGNDMLLGQTGTDYLAGGAGNDTYVYKKGDGVDTISDASGINYINIEGYSEYDFKAYRTNWNDITLEFTNSDGTVEKLVIEGFYTSEAARNFYLSFNGGSKVHAGAGYSPLRTVYGTASDDYMVVLDDGGSTLLGESGNDTLNGMNGYDRLYGGEGMDRLLGNGGNDVLFGEGGNDYLYGGAGDDTYMFAKGNGMDTITDSEGINNISFGSGFDAEDLRAYRTNWNDLTITFEGSDDSLVIAGYFVSEDNRRFNMSFADGSYYKYEDIFTETDVQVLKLTEEMSAFGNTSVVSEMTQLTMTDTMYMTDQLIAVTDI